ncbi:MAG: IS200/IS605 family accessory protein TnpB-related protein, partial [Shewanellaceae bacterium]|nr:IS200/IS605 family accessory protein TnpB-related protein [Shewanellaceae bacterium]
DHLHKVSKRIIDLCLETDTGKIMIGKNKDWKQSINIGKVNNQKFVSIPHAEFIKKIQYKAEAHGIEVVIREESYTSKASAIDLDTIPTYQDSGERIFSGRRIKRGLYKASCFNLINADVNGALNILRKEIGNAFAKGLFDSGCVFQPMRATC